MTCLRYVVASNCCNDIIKPRARFACLVRREARSGEVAEVKKSTSSVLYNDILADRLDCFQ